MTFKKQLVFWLFFVVTLVVLFKFYAPYFVRNKIVKLVIADCSDCELKIDNVEINIFKREIVLNKIRFVTSQSRLPLIATSAVRVSAGIYPTAFLQKTLSLGNVSIEKPVVAILDKTPLVPAREKKSLEDAAPLQIEVLDVEMRNGTFIFQHLNDGKKGVLTLNDLNIHIDPFGTTDSLKNLSTRGTVTGVIEKSGKFNLIVDSKIWAPELYMNVDLKVQDLNLSELNSYFGPDLGMYVKGKLLNGKSDIILRGNSASAKVYAKYIGLHLTAVPNEKRNGIEALITNIVSALKLNDKNIDTAPQFREQSATIKREKKEFLIGFILRALREATFKVASKK